MPDESKAANVEKYIEPHPRKPGRADALIAGTGVPVWAIVAHWQLVGDIQQVADDYLVSREAVEAALEYYRKNKPQIDVRIEENTAA
jgi:uncharacterized protein (DUF433 family)